MTIKYLFYLLFILSSSVNAFLIQTFRNENNIPIQQRWHNAENISITMDIAGSDDLEPKQTYKIIRESFQVWEDVSTSNLHFKFTENSNNKRPSQKDRINLVFFDETNEYLQAPEGSGVIAITRVNSITKTGEIIDADIIFNGRDFNFSAEAHSVNTINLKDVAVHEVGHLMGLEHTPLDGHPTVRPTMNPYNRGDEQGEGQSLEPDDIAGISYLYPASNYLSRVSNANGEISDVDGNPIFGVHVIAKNIKTGAVTSTISGAFDKHVNEGKYYIMGLLPGLYKIYIEPISGEIGPKNFGGIFSDFPTNFSIEFYDNIKLENLAIPLTVTAGENLSGINFITGLTRPGYPYVESLSQISNTPDQKGPYVVRASTKDTQYLWLEYWSNSDKRIYRLSMLRNDSGIFVGEIPGQPAETQVNYRFEAQGPNGSTTISPSGEHTFYFDIIHERELEQLIAFTALRNENIVTVYGINSNKELARISVGEQPIQTLLHQDRNELFVTNLGSNYISVINTKTFQEEARIPTDNQPLDLTFSPDKSILYASNSGSATITIIDTNNRMARSVSLPNIQRGPFGIAAGNKRIYITDIDVDRVMSLNTDGSFRKSIPVPPQPRSLALDYQRDFLWVSCLNSNLLTLIGTQKEEVIDQIELPVSGTFAIELDIKSGTVFVSAHHDNALIIVDGQNREILANINTGINPRGIFVSPETGNLYVTSAQSNKTLLINLDNFAVVDSFSTGIEPRGIAVINPSRSISPTIVSTLTNEQPKKPSLLSFPNPFNSTTKILFNIPETKNNTIANLTVFNLLGQHVQTLQNSKLQHGPHTINWDGRDKNGNYLGSGYYFLKFVHNNIELKQKITLIR
ncbi:MAG: matrixin family metalloprotease [Candidatus Latescibacterota bacterium]|nr:matrixin family metalloprotease [Candidatus Latescibacterota bacterium]